MNKSELFPLICERLTPLLSSNGYKFLKSREKFQKTGHGVRIWIEPNVTYWASSDYCMVSPRMSAHIDALENVLAKHEKKKVDRHSSTVSIISDNLPGAKFWTITSLDDFNGQVSEIEHIIKYVCIPLLENWSEHRILAANMIENEPELFHSELHRLTTLFAYACAFRDDEIKSAIIQSVDLESIKRSQCQIDPYYRQVLKSMETDIPEIGEIGVDL